MAAAFGSSEWRNSRQLLDPREGAKGHPDPNDLRSPAQRDRDRVLYSPFFMRLSGVTQIVGIYERRQFHNRMTHSLKVAQVGRRIAETLKESAQGSDQEGDGGLDPDVVEAACLVHDLGHPPFGHVAEHELNRLLTGNSLEGFEGNAQSFRIVTKLSFRKLNEPGLNLTRATLNATLKYPWLRGQHPSPTYEGKWGAYESEKAAFDYARESAQPKRRTLEATLMDLADDITYAVHDLEDFYRAGLVPLDRLRVDGRESRDFIDQTARYLEGRGQKGEEFRKAFERLRSSFPVDMYTGSPADRIALHGWASAMIGYFTAAVGQASGWSVPEDYLYEIQALKQITWHFVINSPALATLHRGQAEIISGLFSRLTDWAEQAWGKPHELRQLPVGLRHLLVAARDVGESHKQAADRTGLVGRAVADFIASLGENQAIDLHERLTGRSTSQALESWLGA